MCRSDRDDENVMRRMGRKERRKCREKERGRVVSGWVGGRSEKEAKGKEWGEGGKKGGGKKFQKR